MSYFVTIVIIDMNKAYFISLPFLKICFILFLSLQQNKAKRDNNRRQLKGVEKWLLLKN